MPGDSTKVFLHWEDVLAVHSVNMLSISLADAWGWQYFVQYHGGRSTACLLSPPVETCTTRDTTT